MVQMQSTSFPLHDLDPQTYVAKPFARRQPMSSEQTTNVIVLDDDPDMQRIVSDYLSQNNIFVTVASGWTDMQRLLDAGRFDLVILDMHLGPVDGLEILRDLRSRSDLPVIITSGYRRDEIDRVVGLELGADDYIIKPFSLREFLARIRAVLRRIDTARSAVAKEKTPDGVHRTLRFGQWTLDRRLRHLTNGVDPIPLTNGEYALLIAFLDAPQRPLSREHLLRATRLHEDVFDRSIDVQILRLRRKLKVDPSSPSVIRTERGVGYAFMLSVVAA